jgi:hypothetical protein
MQIVIRLDRLEKLGFTTSARIIQDKITGHHKGVEIHVETFKGAEFPIVETIQLHSNVMKEVDDEFMDTQFRILERAVIRHILFKE